MPGKQLVFVTNNSTKSRADYKKKFDKMGITASEVCLHTSIRQRLGTTATDTHQRRKSSARPTAQPFTSPASSSSKPPKTKST